MLQRWYPDGYLSIYSDGLEPTRDHSRFRLFKLLYDVEYFPKGFFPKWQLHRGIFPNVQFPKRQLYKSVLAAALGPQPVLAAALIPHCSLWRLRGPNLIFGKLPLGKVLNTCYKGLPTKDETSETTVHWSVQYFKYFLIFRILCN